MRKVIQISGILILLNIGLLVFIELSKDWHNYLVFLGVVLILFFLVTVFIEYGRRSYFKKFFTSNKGKTASGNQDKNGLKNKSDGLTFESKYKERNSGITWNRESLHSSNSTRGKHHKFLRSFNKR